MFLLFTRGLNKKQGALTACSVLLCGEVGTAEAHSCCEWGVWAKAMYSIDTKHLLETKKRISNEFCLEKLSTLNFKDSFRMYRVEA